MELKSLLNNPEIEVISLSDLNDYEEIEETGTTFLENAKLKALTIAKKYHLPTLADDSGLEVYSLNMEPGVYSARYSGKGDLENCLKLLANMKEKKDRKARFISVIAYIDKDLKFKSFEGTWEGEISFNIKGENGFGYDSVFIPEGYHITAAQMESSLKNSISHRAKALKKLIEEL